MNDSATAHFSIFVRNHFYDEYLNRWIGKGGSKLCPVLTPDLNFLKSLVHSTIVENVEHLRKRIIAGCSEKEKFFVKWRLDPLQLSCAEEVQLNRYVHMQL